MEEGWDNNRSAGRERRKVKRRWTFEWDGGGEKQKCRAGKPTPVKEEETGKVVDSMGYDKGMWDRCWDGTGRDGAGQVVWGGVGWGSEGRAPPPPPEP